MILNNNVSNGKDEILNESIKSLGFKE